MKFPLPERLVLIALSALGLLWGCAPPAPETDGGPAQVLRLTESQYRNTIADIFGSDIVVAGRFEPLIRPADGLLAEGAALISVSQAGFGQYEQMARGIALQVVDEEHRAVLLPCEPAIDEEMLDVACAAEFLGEVAKLLFRRPVSDGEVEAFVAAASEAAQNMEDPYKGLAIGLTGLLVSPEFLFRIERPEPDPDIRGEYRLDAFSKAARLSYLLWDTTPDEELLAVAEHGELHDRAGLVAQVERLLNSPRVENGVRAFFADMLNFERLEVVSKDAMLFPKYGREVVRDSEEQILRTIVDHVVRRDGDYRELFTTRRTFMSRPLGMIYRVPVETPDGFERYEFAAGSGRAGIQSLVGFVSMHSHSGRSSPTLRGMAIRELLLCQKVPDPPSNVDFAVTEGDDNPALRTARGRLSVHATDPACSGCHRIMDPIGLALENFDAAGAFRTSENGESIDPSGTLDGIEFADPAGLGEALSRHPGVASCLVERAYEYATGRRLMPGEREWRAYLVEDFAAGGHRVLDLLESIAMSDAFYRVIPPTQSAGVKPEPTGDLAHIQGAER